MELNRRRVLNGLAGLSGLTLLSGCKELIESVAESCPSDPAESGGVTWIPDVGHPVFWGFQELTTTNGAPRDMRVFYPTHEGFTEGPPILKLCLTRWPIVLFLHGQPPNNVSTNGWHRKWHLLPAVLARCGYVVVVPNHDARLPKEDFAGQVAAAVQDIDFIRNGWIESKWVDKRQSSTAVAGHSFGALLAARVAAARQDFGAFVSLGGGFINFDSDTLPALQAITQPSFFMWGKGDELVLANEDLDGTLKLWDKLGQTKYAAVYQGEHFDYLPATDTPSTPFHGPCSLIGGVSADLVALFLSSHIPVGATRTKIPVELKPPTVELTREQEFFAGAHLQGLAGFQTRAGCRLDLRWKVAGVTGSRRLGP